MLNVKLDNIILASKENMAEITKEDVSSNDNKHLVNILKSKNCHGNTLDQKKQGVYLFFKNNTELKNIVYIGKAGTFDNENKSRKFKGQTLYGRLKNTRDNKKAAEYFKQKFEEDSLDKIIIAYYYSNNAVLPAFLEAVLLQEYFSSYQLPAWNKSF
jgi:hypothetical protein